MTGDPRNKRNSDRKPVTAATQREARLKVALKANLARRKAQVRVRTQTDTQVYGATSEPEPLHDAQAPPTGGDIPAPPVGGDTQAPNKTGDTP